MCICDERTSAAVEVGKIVSEDMYGCFPFRQGGEAHAVHIELHRAWAKAKFESKGWRLGLTVEGI